MLAFFENIDTQLFWLINQSWSSAWLDTFMILASEKWAWLPLYLLIIAYFIKKFRHKAWIFIVAIIITVGLADSISSKVFKPLVHRTRPCNVQKLNARTPDGCSQSYGFVSSHAANHTAIAALTILILGLRRLPRFTMILWAFIIGYSRVYLGKHYPLDVLCGALLGLMLAYLALFLLRKYRFLQEN